ncbi:MAG: carbohydrate kinase [Ruminiclostridium sp.]|nr:carbohydrate kinase [Ruminiclostridium sp.]
MKKYDVTALGELLIDFTESGESGQGNPLLEANPGGAPCNVLAMLNKLGRKTAFIGKVGNDNFGKMLAKTVLESGTDTSNLLFDEKVHTTLAFVHTFENGEREFSFYRDPGADMMLTKDDVKDEILESTKIFHFGTLSSTHEKPREATRYAIKTAKNAGALISFHPNLREPLWNSLDDAKREIEYGLSKCDILKISDNELEFVTGMTDYDRAIQALKDKYDIPVIFLTLGKDGSAAYYKDIAVRKSAFTKIKAIEKTGAGDTFEGCALNFILEYGIDGLDREKLSRMLTFANAGASLITARKGALKVMPEREDIEKLIDDEGNA